jgi:YVTN family beta-propeller protein
MDPDLAVIRRYGILNEEQGNIPHPTAAIVDRAGIVRYLRVDRDYTKRPSTTELLEALRRLDAGAVTSGAPAVRGTLVVLNKAEATASLVDLATGRVAATVPTGDGPHEVAVSPDGRLAVVTNYGRSQAGSTLTVIDVPAGGVAKTIDLAPHRRPHGVAWLADGRRIVVTAEEDRALLTVDVDTGAIVSKVETGQKVSHMVAVTPDGVRAFVANIGSGSVSVIDLREGKLVKDVPTGAGAEGIDITPDGRHVWVTNREADTVTVLDAGSLAVVKELPSKSFPIRARLTPDGRHVLVSNARTGDVAVFDARERREVRRIPLRLPASATEGRLFGGAFGDSSVPIGILVHPGGKVAWVAHANADLVTVLDLETWAPAGTLRAGREPDGLGYSPLAPPGG